MEYYYIAPPLPTVARWCTMRRKYPGYSTLRALEYERLETANIFGHVLDVGGGEQSNTNMFLSKADRVDSINISPDMKPTYLVAPGSPFPVESGIYDVVVCLNTLEHIFDATSMLLEIRRVLKTGGILYITVPFMFRIHASPDDYFRATPSWWEETLNSVGFSRVELSPLVWGRHTTAAEICNFSGFLPKVVIKEWAYFKDILYSRLMFRGVDDYDGPRGERICAVSLGWFISSTK
ncbi:MAG: class I SAM-dependent methyltransferase [Gammaproteobacteria bacterium]|nr:class I SAM-dependent methyltransferase [Gammaproteobacteria bacterium]MYJ52490.1 class I SAM-dependent methyltransferase [Gammaproteobacteria bacterium]